MTESNRKDVQQQLFEPGMFERALADGTEAGRSRAPRFLVVDDEPEGRALVTGVIRSRWPGAVVRLASSNAEAFQILLGFTPDIVVTELSRAGGAGYEFLRKLRLSPRLAATPVVLSSRRGDPGDAFGISVEGLHEAAGRRLSQEAMLAALFESLLGRGSLIERGSP
ncbi:MAG TPA: response regulator [Syntrophales bacterium]|nr:response regulator [Syntrophales bacterium]